MAKRFLDDMKKGVKKETEYKIPVKVVPESKPEIKPEVTHEIKTRGTPREYPKPEYDFGNDYFHDNKRTRVKVENRSRYGLWGVAIFSVVFLLFSFSWLFAGATVVVSPRVEDLNLNQNFSAVKDDTTGGLPFQLVIIPGEEDKNVEGGDARNVSLSAHGSVVLYNTFSTAPQILSIDTRLEGSNGKMYKTKEKVIVPGMTKSGTPGSVSADIYAAEAGDTYNSGPLDFKVFGFKGSPKYDKFYARSTGNVVGGFIGSMRQISDTDQAQLVTEMKAELEAKLSGQAAGQIPAGFILFKNASVVTIDQQNFSSTDPTADSTTIPVSLKGTFYGILFDEKALTKKIIEKSFPGEEDNDIYIQNIQDLTFTMTPQPGLSNFGDIQTMNFNLTGKTKAVWRIDQSQLVTDIQGKKKSDFNQILAQYPNVLSANLSLRPFWKRSLPEKSKDIQVNVSYPQ